VNRNEEMLGMLAAGERECIETLRLLAEHHPDEADVVHTVTWMIPEAERRVAALGALLGGGADVGNRGPLERAAGWARERIGAVAGSSPRSGPMLVAELRDGYGEVQQVWLDWTIARQLAMASRDAELLALCETSLTETARRAKWLLTLVKQAAPQALA